MANNNALSMVALGLAAAGGGGGGTPYTAGQGIDITNHLVKVKMIEGQGLNFGDDGTIKTSEFRGASATEEGALGMVPAPLAGDTNKYLKSDGTWALAGEPTDYVKSVSVDEPGEGTHGVATFTTVEEGQQGTTSITYNYVEANYPGTPTSTLTSLNIDGTEYAFDDSTYICTFNSTTYEDAVSAYNAGKHLIAKSNNTYYQLQTYYEEQFTFYNITETLIAYYLVLNSHGWSNPEASLQAKLTAGSNINISGATISATDTTYSAGTNITITSGAINAPSNVSVFTNDAGYLTLSTLPKYNGEVE